MIAFLVLLILWPFIITLAAEIHAKKKGLENSKTGVYHLGKGFYIVQKPFVRDDSRLIKLYFCPCNRFSKIYYTGYAILNTGIVYSNQWDRP